MHNKYILQRLRLSFITCFNTILLNLDLVELNYLTGLLPVIVLLYWEVAGILECQKHCASSCWRSRINLDRQIRFQEVKTRPGLSIHHNVLIFCCPTWLPCFWNFSPASCFSLVNIKNPAARWWFSKELRCYRKKFLPVELLIVQSRQSYITEWTKGELFLERKEVHLCVFFFLFYLFRAW